jgi:hypothetical protein
MENVGQRLLLCALSGKFGAFVSGRHPAPTFSTAESSKRVTSDLYSGLKKCTLEAWWPRVQTVGLGTRKLREGTVDDVNPYLSIFYAQVL